MAPLTFSGNLNRLPLERILGTTTTDDSGTSFLFLYPVPRNYGAGFTGILSFYPQASGIGILSTVSRVRAITSWGCRNAPWGHGGVYTAPVRAWGYDPLFNSVANLPPFTPMTVVAVDVVCW
jgi:hypothetical protein